jgi:hypothetical protein
VGRTQNFVLVSALKLPEALVEECERTGLCCRRRTEENVDEIRKTVNEK